MVDDTIGTRGKQGGQRLGLFGKVEKWSERNRRYKVFSNYCLGSFFCSLLHSTEALSMIFADFSLYTVHCTPAQGEFGK
jgi:hypothetical protein